jgi:hypothetical protein
MLHIFTAMVIIVMPDLVKTVYFVHVIHKK